MQTGKMVQARVCTQQKETRAIEEDKKPTGAKAVPMELSFEYGLLCASTAGGARTSTTRAETKSMDDEGGGGD